MGKCLAYDCKTGVPCKRLARNPTRDSGNLYVYCDEHYANYEKGSSYICGGLSDRRTMSEVAMSSAQVYSPRSSRAAMSPRSSSSNYSKPVSPRFQQIVQNDYYGTDNEDEEDEEEEEGFETQTNLKKKRAYRPKTLFTRRKTSPNFTAKTGSVELLFEIDETDDVNVAIRNLQQFKLNVFAADINTTNKPKDFIQRSSVTEDVVNQSAKVLAEYMNNPMRIELVLSFLYDYDTRDLDVNFGYFGLRKPNDALAKQLLKTTLDEYIRQNYDDDWYKFPTPSVHIDYSEDIGKREQIRTKISKGILNWSSDTSSGLFNRKLEDLRERIKGEKFNYTPANKIYEELIPLWELYKKENTKDNKSKGGDNNKSKGGDAATEEQKTSITTSGSATATTNGPNLKLFVKKLKSLSADEKSKIYPIPNITKNQIVAKIKSLIGDNSFETVMKSNDDSVNNVNYGIINFLKKIGDEFKEKDKTKFNKLVEDFEKLNNVNQISSILTNVITQGANPQQVVMTPGGPVIANLPPLAGVGSPGSEKKTRQ